MIVVADASPLIFLGKLRCLNLLHELFGRDIRIPRAVRDEVLCKGIDPIEEEVLQEFLGTCRVETVAHPKRFARAMSRADNEALTLALRCRADRLLCDESATRLMAEAEGVRPVGTLGVLLLAMRQGNLTPAVTRRHVDALVRDHGFRMGIDLYQAVVARIEQGTP
jgi:predicted nucleic acid-binding protein